MWSSIFGHWILLNHREGLLIYILGVILLITDFFIPIFSTLILLYFSDPGTSICPYLRVEKVITKSQYGAYPRTCPVLESIPLGISTPTIGALCLSIVFNIESKFCPLGCNR